MIQAKRNRLRYRAVTWLVLMAAQSLPSCAGQEASLEALIESLTSEPPNSNPFISLNICPSDQELIENRADRGTALSLVGLGNSATPGIDKQLKLIESDVPVRNAWLLLHAYARIRGTSGVQELWKLRSSSYSYVVADSIALALGLTGYVFDSQLLPSIPIHYCRPPVPRDSLNQLILAWEQDNPAWLQIHVGPRARESLNVLLKGETWGRMRTDLPGSGVQKEIAVGYRLARQSLWEAPEETLADAQVAPLQYDRPVEPVNPELDAVFTDRAGRECGRHRISFLGDGHGHDEYVVDEPDMEGLLRVIAACSAEKGQ